MYRSIPSIDIAGNQPSNLVMNKIESRAWLQMLRESMRAHDRTKAQVVGAEFFYLSAGLANLPYIRVWVGIQILFVAFVEAGEILFHEKSQ
jgi:hypothetical protein